MVASGRTVKDRWKAFPLTSRVTPMGFPLHTRKGANSTNFTGFLGVRRKQMMRNRHSENLKGKGMDASTSVKSPLLCLSAFSLIQTFMAFLPCQPFY